MFKHATNLNRNETNHGHARRVSDEWIAEYHSWCPSCRAVLTTQHEQGEHDDLVIDCPTCRAEARELGIELPR